MRLVNKEVTRQGDIITIRGVWCDRFKRYGTVEIKEKTMHEGVPMPTTIISGDAGDVFKTLSSLAEIAWGQGWRPKNLTGTLVGVIENYKIPDIE
jgi:hypothetical protein